MNKIMENNQVTVSGMIVSEFSYSHESYGEKFYIVDLEAKRISGCADVLKVMVSERLLDVSQNYVGCLVCVTGQFRSYNEQEENKSRLMLNVFARDFEFIELDNKKSFLNEIYLEGFICKTPTYRKTPFGREISDIILAVNRPYGKTDYLPCIAWGRNAFFASELPIGTNIAVCGRIQSREYLKHLEDGKTETRTAFEVSISKIGVVEYE